MTRSRSLRIATLIVAVAGLAALACPAAAEPPAAGEPFASMYGSAEPFLAAIARERPDGTVPAVPLTGLVVPHHLLAADLIARGFWAAAGHRYDRVVILAPDHFHRARHPLATTTRDFATVLGPVATDREAVAALLAEPDLAEESDLFDGEHGIAALLPFVKRLVPEARIVPVAISVEATRADWDRAAAAIGRIAGPDTLVVQSTDFSHYRPIGETLVRDQESLNVLAAGDPEAVTGLVASDHVDSRAALYIQMRLQAARGSRPVVLASRNSTEYVADATRLTSYLTVAYSPEAAAWPRRYADQEVVVFGGDIFAGRFLTRPLAEPTVAAALVRRVRALTGGAPLVVNLEGAVLRDPPENASPDLHAMHAGLALPLLKALGVTAAGLANNHAFDLGRAGYRESASLLSGAGIVPLTHGRVVDLGPLRIVALNFVGRHDRSGFPVVTGEGDLERLCREPARPPFVAFVHWGEEYVDALAPELASAAATLNRCGIGFVIGAHSHRGSDRIAAPAGGAYGLVPSLGNLLFDQSAARGSGTLLEMRIFREGTVATRLLPLPNLFDLGTALLRARTAPADEAEPARVTAPPPDPEDGSAGNR